MALFMYNVEAHPLLRTAVKAVRYVLRAGDQGQSVVLRT